jgi:RNase P protein component
MREVFRRSPYYLKGEHKHFLVWVARGPVSELTFADFSKGMLELLAKTFPK